MKAILSAVAVAAIALLFAWCITVWADMPLVYKSWSTQECVKVEDPAGKYSCDNLPGRYELVWAK